MGIREKSQHFFPLTSLQIGDLQSYLSCLCLFLPPESNKLFILVDNRPWLIHLDSRPAHLWQLMVTKSRMSPFANTKGRRGKKDIKKRHDFKVDFKGTFRPNSWEIKKFEKWLGLISAAALSQKEALLPVKKLKNAILLNNELHRTLYGFIVFEVAWADVRGINYLNELQTDTSMAIEAKWMKRWEFDSVEQALRYIASWFSGTNSELLLLQDYLDSIIEEAFHDAEENFAGCQGTGVYPANMGYSTWMLYTPPPPDGPYKRRKITKPSPFRSGVDRSAEESHSDVVSSQTNSETSTPTNNHGDCTAEASQYRDVLVLFRFNDHDLPFKLRHIIMRDLRLLTLLESGLPSWVIFLQSYPLFCHLYRPWMCPLARALYVLISVVTVLIGFYDLYKNVPVLKATASRLFGPLFDWIETWEMLSRIQYLGTMLFLHNFEKAVKWFLMVTRSFRSFFSVLSQPIPEPVLELLGFLYPFWNGCLQAVENFFSIAWIFFDSSCSLIIYAVQILVLPISFILYVFWSIATTILYPIVWAFAEILYAPIRLLLALTSFIAFICSCLFDFVGEFWLFASSLFQLASASEAAVSTYEVSLWRSLWNDLFSQVFRAIRSILNGFVAFFAACNRHRLSIYNHMLEFFRRLSCLTDRSQPLELDSGFGNRYGATNILQPLELDSGFGNRYGARIPVESRKLHGRHLHHPHMKPHSRRNASQDIWGYEL